jgi:hypothetical protein
LLDFCTSSCSIFEWTLRSASSSYLIVMWEKMACRSERNIECQVIIFHHCCYVLIFSNSSDSSVASTRKHCRKSSASQTTRSFSVLFTCMHSSFTCSYFFVTGFFCEVTVLLQEQSHQDTNQNWTSSQSFFFVTPLTSTFSSRINNSNSVSLNMSICWTFWLIPFIAWSFCLFGLLKNHKSQSDTHFDRRIKEA